jgi:hypothetical protein
MKQYVPRLPHGVGLQRKNPLNFKEELVERVGFELASDKRVIYHSD